MNSEEERVYDAAVEFIESHGGIVFNPHEKHASIIAKIEVNLEDKPKTTRKSKETPKPVTPTPEPVVAEPTPETVQETLHPVPEPQQPEAKPGEPNTAFSEQKSPVNVGEQVSNANAATLPQPGQTPQVQPQQSTQQPQAQPQAQPQTQPTPTPNPSSQW